MKNSKNNSNYEIELTNTDEQFNSEKKSNKAIKINGLIISIIILISGIITFVADFFQLSKVHYKTTLILPIVMSVSLLISGIIGLIAVTKLSKKIFTSAITFLIISVFCFFGCKVINPLIITNNAAPADESESAVLSYKGSCEFTPYNDLLKEPKKYKGNQIVNLGYVVKVVNVENNLSEYVVDISNHIGYSNKVYLIYPHVEKNNVDLKENDIIAFYGESRGLYKCADSGEQLPKVEVRYIEYYSHLTD